MNKAYHKFIYSYTIAMLLLLVTLTACNTKKTEADSQPAFQIDQESIKLGQEGLVRFEKTITYYPDSSLQHYVQQVGQRILNATPAKNTPFTFRLIESAYPQAYALPNGHVFLTTGMLALFSNESQLAALLAHEIAHVIAGHTRNRSRKRKQIASLTQRLNKALTTKRSHEMTRLFGKVSIQNYSRKNEYQADKLSVGYLQRSPYSEYATLDVLERLQLSMLKATKNTSDKQRIFSSHPAIEKRIETLKRLYPHESTPVEKKYLIRINNLVLDRKKGKRLQLKLYTFTTKDALSNHLRKIEKQNHLLYELILAINFAKAENQLKSGQILKWLVVTDDIKAAH